MLYSCGRLQASGRLCPLLLRSRARGGKGEGELWEAINAPPISSGGSQSSLHQPCVSFFFAALSAAARSGRIRNGSIPEVSPETIITIWRRG